MDKEAAVMAKPQRMQTTCANGHTRVIEAVRDNYFTSDADFCGQCAAPVIDQVTPPSDPPAPDFTVRNEGTIFVLTPHTEAAQDWIDAHLDLAEWQRWAFGVVVEHRYVADIVAGIQADGLAVR